MTEFNFWVNYPLSGTSDDMRCIRKPNHSDESDF